MIDVASCFWVCGYIISSCWDGDNAHEVESVVREVGRVAAWADGNCAYRYTTFDWEFEVEHTVACLVCVNRDTDGLSC